MGVSRFPSRFVPCAKTTFSNRVGSGEPTVLEVRQMTLKRVFLIMIG